MTEKKEGVKTTDEIKLGEILHNIQVKIKAPKDKVNKFGKYKFRNCSTILEMLKPLLPSETWIRLSDEVVQKGERFYVQSTATLSYRSASISSNAEAREASEKKGMDPAQLSGACSSYARKTALCGLLALDDSEDIDEQDNEKPEERYKYGFPIDHPKIQDIVDFCNKSGFEIDDSTNIFYATSPSRIAQWDSFRANN